MPRVWAYSFLSPIQNTLTYPLDQGIRGRTSYSTHLQKHMEQLLKIIIFLSSLSFISGCSTNESRSADIQAKTITQAGTIGAVLGAAAGVVSKRSGKGALIGGTIGAIAGYAANKRLLDASITQEKLQKELNNLNLSIRQAELLNSRVTAHIQELEAAIVLAQHHNRALSYERERILNELSGSASKMADLRNRYAGILGDLAHFEGSEYADVRTDSVRLKEEANRAKENIRRYEIELNRLIGMHAR